MLLTGGILVGNENNMKKIIYYRSAKTASTSIIQGIRKSIKILTMKLNSIKVRKRYLVFGV